jgi:predicted rRNA pseudouridine synthase
MFGAPRAGHAGTLDPGVSGILVIAMGKALRLLPLLLDFPKRYVALIQLHGSVRPNDLTRVLEEFQGEIYQTPPVRSAVRRERRIRRIHRLKLVEKQGFMLLVDVTCESGTYVRTLAVDIGDALGVGAHMAELRRIESGPYTERMAVTLSTLSDAVATAREGDMTMLNATMRPPSDVWKLVAAIVIKDSAVDAIAHGAGLAAAGVLRIPRPFPKGANVALITKGEELVAVGESLVESDRLRDEKEGWVVETHKVFIAPGRYPRSWGKTAHKDKEGEPP